MVEIYDRVFETVFDEKQNSYLQCMYSLWQTFCKTLHFVTTYMKSVELRSI